MHGIILCLASREVKRWASGSIESQQLRAASSGCPSAKTRWGMGVRVGGRGRSMITDFTPDMRFAEAPGSSYFYHHNWSNVSSKSKQAGRPIFLLFPKRASQPQHCWHFRWDPSLLHSKMFSSIPDLRSLEASCDNHRCLQTMQNIPWRAKAPQAENYCSIDV